MNAVCRNGEAETESIDPVDAMLDLLFERACELAFRVEMGVLPFIEAVDLAYSAAEWSGLVDLAGPDLVQSVLAAGFRSTPQG